MLEKKKTKVKIERILKSLFSNLKTIESGDILEFSKKYRILGRTQSSLSGKFTPFPFQVEFHNAVSSNKYQEVVICGAAQVTGKSETINNIILYYLVVEAAGILYLMPTELAAEKTAKEKINPMLELSPVSRGLLSKSGRNSNNRKTYKKLKNGGYIRFIGPSPSNLSAESVQVVIADEVDRYPTTNEGTALELLHKRASSFSNAKKLTISTPTYTQTSEIWKRFLSGTQSYFYIKSPYCDDYFTIGMEHFRIDKEEPKKSTLICPFTGNPISDDQRKDAIYQTGVWRDKNPSAIIKSFHLNGFYKVTRHQTGYDSFYHQIAVEYLQCEGDQKKLQTFQNTFLALPVEQKDGEKMEAGDYEKYLIDVDFEKLPNDIIAVTAGVDIQKNRKEVYIYGWTEDCRPTLLQNETIFGEPQDQDTWEQLEKLIDNTVYTREDGKKLKVTKTFIDSGAWQSTVLRFTENKNYKGIWPSKGSSVSNAPLIENAPNKKNRQYIIGGNEGKDYIFSDYSLGRIKFNRKFADAEYFKQLFSEVRVVKDGKITYEKPTSDTRNEALDCFVYAYAAAKVKNYLKFQKANLQLNDKPIEEKKPEIVSPEVPEKPKIQHPIGQGKKYVPNWMRNNSY